MNIVFYTNHSDPRTLNKSLTELSTHDIKLLKPTNIMHPQLDLATQIPPEANYCYIEALGRYYYINAQTIIPGKINTTMLDVDVLMSFKSIINSSYVISNRSTNKPNKLLPDSLPILAKRNVLYKRLTGGITATGKFGSDVVNSASPSILLTVINGRGEAPGGSITLNTPVINDNQVSLTWTKVEEAEKYYVYRKGENDSDYKVIGMPSVQLFDDLITESGTYMYYVRAFSNFALGEPSNTVSATVTVEG